MTGENERQQPSTRDFWLDAALVLVLFFVYAGIPVPDVNETHYLPKAKHAWDPAWCEKDLFLQSRDAHRVFFLTWGWLTKVLSLPVVAWVGRVASWSLLAWGWTRVCRALGWGRFMPLLSALLWLVAMDRCHLAGEWVVGGFEAKGIAYFFVLLAIESCLRSKWNRAWIWGGVAAAFHVLVGGWMVLIMLLTALMDSEARKLSFRHVPGLLTGFAISLAGLLPVLLLDVRTPAEVVSQAQQIYVFERLPHHLVFSSIALIHKLAFGGLLLMAGVLAAIVRPDPSIRLLGKLAACSVLLVSVGIGAEWATRDAPELAAKWLRFYWFRLADFLVPLYCAFAFTALWRRWQASRPRWGIAWLGAGVAVAGFSLLDTYWYHHWEDRPMAIATVQRSGGPKWKARRYASWLRMCDWVRAHTPEDSLCLTPRPQQSFRWYAHRAEAVCWKDVPQDAAGVMEWQRRIEQLFPEKVLQSGLTAHSDAELVRLADDVGATLLVVDHDRSPRVPGFQRLFPTLPGPGDAYYVYRIPPKSALPQ